MTLHRVRLSAPQDDRVLEPDSLWSWVWDGGFLMSDAPMRGSDVVTEKPCMISVAGRLCSPQVDGRTVIARDRLFEDNLSRINSAGTTWEYDEGQLLTLSMTLWTSLIHDKVRIDTLPLLPSAAQGGFPYLFEGMHRIVSSLPHLIPALITFIIACRSRGSCERPSYPSLK